MRDPETVPGELALPPPEQHPPMTEMEHNRLAVRLSFMIAALTMLVINAVPLALLFSPVASIMRQSATVASSGNAQWFGFAFIASLALSLPFVAMQVAAPRCRWRRAIVFAAGIGHAAAAVAWVLMGMLSSGLDYGFYGWVLVLDGMANLAFGFTLALSANHETLRELQRVDP